MEPKPQDSGFRYSTLPLEGSSQQNRIPKTLNFRQAGEYYRSLPKKDQQDLVANLATDLAKVKNDDTRYIMLSYFYKADTTYGSALAKTMHADVSRVAQLASTLNE